jgi:putative glutamine amidotransferase
LTTPPLIGVSVGHFPSGSRVLDGADREYGRAVQQAGGAPVLIPATADYPLQAVVDRIDGLLLTGGGDVAPEVYGGPSSPECGGVDPERDGVEAALVAAALRRRIPVLGICRGCQLLNAVLGGTLHQHLPAVTGLDHLHPEPRNCLVHSVTIDQDSLLRQVVGTAGLEVNSIHHQAIDRVAEGLRPVACAPDGVIEAVEDPGRSILAVQWHPESLVPDGPQLELFRWLTGAAREERR